MHLLRLRRHTPEQRRPPRTIRRLRAQLKSASPEGHGAFSAEMALISCLSCRLRLR